MGVTAEIAIQLEATPRPDAPLQQHPLGYSAGPRYGRFAFGITYEEMVARFGGELAFAARLTQLLARLDVPGDSPEGDYE